MANVAAEVVQAFRLFDADDSGTITEDELREVLLTLDPGQWTEDNITQLFKEIDVDSDLQIQYEEFCDWIFGDDASDWEDMKDELLQDEADWEVMVPARCNSSGKLKGGRGPKREKKKKKIKTAEASKTEMTKPMKGRMLIFFDVDGVLNTQMEIPESPSSPDVSSMLRRGHGLLSSVHDAGNRWGLHLNRDCLKRLRVLLDSFDERPKNRARLVLTSTQRLSEAQSDLIREALVETGISPKAMMGSSASIGGATRAEEILHYLALQAKEHKEVTGWIAIDDDPDNLEAIEAENSLCTSEFTGLDAAAIGVARKSLSLQDADWHRKRGFRPPGYMSFFDPSAEPGVHLSQPTESLGHRSGSGEPRHRLSVPGNGGNGGNAGGEGRNVKARPRSSSVDPRAPLGWSHTQPANRPRRPSRI